MGHTANGPKGAMHSYCTVLIADLSSETHDVLTPLLDNVGVVNVIYSAEFCFFGDLA